MRKEELKLIAFSLMTGGEYHKITELIKVEATPIPEALEKAKDIKNVITIFDEDYPKKLRELKFPPYVLFYKGDKSLLNKKTVSIVGSRLLDDEAYVTKATKALCDKLNKNNTIVVSGLAKGVDALAHDFAEKSIGVLGCGIDFIYPYDNARLFAKLEQTGLIISEYPERTKPLSFHFPFRNRIIAALGDEMYVMSSKQASGTITAINDTLELQKDVFVLPYSAFSGNYNNTLIDDGARVINLSKEGK